ncbi:MAG: hypothetical protein DRJ47_05290 [Thermoprotei archaeon]|nr:MAG: hypothetical protein DRJ47_05290 [Thermoprotei archaeon]
MGIDEGSLGNFLEYMRKTANKVKGVVEGAHAVVVTHYDADGLSSAAIIAKMLQRLGTTFHIRVVEQVDQSILTDLSELDYDVFIFTDMGSGAFDFISKIISRQNIIIIDHHPPLKNRNNTAGRLIEINPFIFGIDGSSNSSASTLSYLLSKNIDKRNTSLAPLAIVGAVGDRQDMGEYYSLKGLNKIAVEDGIKRGYLKVEMGLRLFGIRSKPLVSCLENTMDPFLPGLTGNEGACLLFLKKIGVEPVEEGRLKTYSMLSEEEKKRLATELVKYLLSKGFSAKMAESIFGTMYFLTQEDVNSPLYDAREYATVLNACGRLEHYSIAIALGLGYRGKVLQKALDDFLQYKKLLSTVLNKLRQNEKRIINMEHVLVVDARGLIPPKVAGSLASILASSRIFNADKPLLVVAGKGKLKISMRQPAKLRKIYYGIHLGEILHHAANKTGGMGGGHAMAAGGTIFDGGFERFLNVLNEVIGWRIKGFKNV